ncbi:AAA family ATPase, partial [Pseudonocardia sp. KRD291]|uniref:AAA family ATPase n=1 Tax=Pseudonocardia sp. KRD291 TaxID=2792007 RepID=UPI001C49FE0D
MLIRSLTLQRYGGYENRELALGPGLTIVTGPNEAGKTTLLDALSDLLWGMPRPVRHAWAFSPARLGIAARVECDGNEVTVRRTTRGLFSSREDEPDAAYDPPWGPGGADARKRWRQGFGLGHEELREGGRRLCAGGGDLAELVFTARSGRDVRAVVGALDGEADKLFKDHKGNKSVEVRAAMGRYEQTETAAGEQMARAGEVTALVEEIGRLERRATELARSRSVAATDSDRARQAVRGHEPARILASLRAERAALEASGVVLDAVRLEEFELASAELDTAADELAEHRSRAEDLRERRAALDVDDLLVADAPRVRELESAAQARAADAERAAALRAEAAELYLRAEASLAGLVADDGRSAAQRLAAVHLPADRARDLDALADALRAAEDGTERAEEAHREALAQVRDAADGAAGLDPDRVGRVEEVRQAIEAEGSAAALSRMAITERARARTHRAEALAAAGHTGAPGHSAAREPSAGPPGLFETGGDLVISVPPARDVRRLRAALRAAEQGASAAVRDAGAARERVRTAVDARDAVAGQGRPVDPGTLSGAREERDRQVSALVEVLRAGTGAANLAGAADLAGAAARAERAIGVADRVADDMIDSADRVAELAHRETELAAAREALAVAEESAAAASAARREAESAWAGLWSAHAVATPEPDEADAVCAALTDAARAQGSIDEADERLERLAGQARTQQDALASALAGAGRSRSGADLDTLLVAAADLAAEADRARDRRVLLARLRTDAERAGGAADAARHERDRAALRWRFGLGSAGLPADLEPAGWATRRDTVGDAQDAGARARRCESEAAALQGAVDAHREAVGALVRAHLPAAAAAEADPLPRLSELAERVREVTAAAVSAAHLDDSVSAAESAAVRAARAAAASRSVLDRLAVELALTETLDEGGVQAAAERGVRAVELDRHAGEAARLLAAAAPDLDPDELVAAAPDTETGALDETRARSEETERELEVAHAEVREQLGGLRARRRALEGADEAALLHAEAQEHLARAADAAERYLVVHLQREILRRELDSYERTHASPLLVDAGRLLERLTGGRFVALRPPADVAAGGRSLVAVRADGEELTPSRLSEGTADQVHLALRLAG